MGCSVMSCKYNNSMHTIEPEEVEVWFDSFEQLLLSEDYESQEELINGKNGVKHVSHNPFTPFFFWR